MPLFTLEQPWPPWLPLQTTSRAVKSAAEKLDGLPAHVAALKHAPPPCRKIISLSEPGLGLTAMPVDEPSRHFASAKGTQVQCSGCRPVMAAELVLLESRPQAIAKGTKTIIRIVCFNIRESSSAVRWFGLFRAREHR